MLLVVILWIVSKCLRFLIKKDDTQPDATTVQYDWHTLSVAQALHKQSTQLSSGLSQAEVKARQNDYGFNQLDETPPEPAWHLLLSQFKSILILVLIIAAIVAAAIGDLSDGIVILIVVIINAFLGFYQEFQAEKSLAALKKMLALQAKVRRDGRVQELSATQLVPGDIVILEAGDKIPADGRIVAANTLEVDESSFTGESVPVTKQKKELRNPATPLAERSNMLYMNNAIVRGRAEMLVTATGMDTEIGKLADLLAQTEDEATPLQLQLDSLGKRLALFALVVVVVLFASAILRGEPLIETAFTAIALAVAAIPEGLPAVVTVTLALGMHRMASQRAIVKRLSAVETLGCTTVICTDKTGTLTVNQMTARAVFYKEQRYSVSGEGYEITGEILPTVSATDLNALLLPLALCNDSHVRDNQVLGDPMEGALLVLAAKGGLSKEQANKQLPRIAEIPFDAEHKFMATFHRQDYEIKIFIKGAPEVLLNLCASALDKDGNAVAIQRQPLLQQNTDMASTGLRVLGLAVRTLPTSEFSWDEDLFPHIKELTFVGLVGLMDPPRVEVREAIKLCHRAGIAVKMITGDQKLTAAAIATEIGLVGDVVDGTELTAMDDATLTARINNIGVFARTAPEQKVRIVSALKAYGHIVAMTGDGVNDAPALKCSDIGIAMGITGTDVAQEAATMILTDDNFATIVKAVKEGRGIYENMVKFIRFQLSTNIGAILCVAAAPLLEMPLPFTAIQLLWINIIMDGPPAMSLGVDPARLNSMNEAPRKTDERILSLRRLGNLFSYGLTMAIGTLGVLYYDLQRGGDTHHATCLAFTTFVLFQVFNVFNARTEKWTAFNRHFFANKAFWASILGVILLQITIVQWSVAEAIFHTTALTAMDWLLATGIAVSVLIFEELRKLGMKLIK
ncbi:MAG: calcium-translocating P-type ATPase, PMCA-type [Methylococcaceae bacterium]|nr:calcium-translocating P-type ATPase, PMCA-type [Methylococcaceae bacterium]